MNLTVGVHNETIVDQGFEDSLSGIWTIYPGSYILSTKCFNLHVTLRGTKQQDAGINDLGAVSAAQRTPSTNVIQVELTSDPLQDTPDSLYDDALRNLRTRKPVERSPGDFYTERVAAARDYYANIRTNVSSLSEKTT